MDRPRADTSRYPMVKADDLAWLSEVQMIEVDRLMIEETGIVLLQMMENAGRNLARLALRRFDPGRVSVLAGPGGNGGGGLVAARHLTNSGTDVSITLTRPPDRLSPTAGLQLDALTHMGVPIGDEPDAEADLIVDAIIGYSLKGAPREPARALIEWTNAQPIPVLALDTPSGLDVTTGRPPGALVEASATLTLALPKLGLRDHPAVGDLYLGDISVPTTVYETLGVAPVPSFRPSPILRVTR